MQQWSSSGPSDFPPKKLVRQLDFTTSHSGGAPPPVAGEAAASAPPQTQQHQISRPSIPTSVKPESPKSCPRPIFEVKDDTPTRKKNCNCKHSRCLKLYCECFASGVYCDGCNCANCCNNVENEAVRHEAVEATLERNPNAFRPKIGSSPHAIRENRASHVKTSGPSFFSSIPVSHAINPAPLGASKITYRSLLADIVQPADAKELCRILVLVSGEAAKSPSDRKNQGEKLEEVEERTESSLASSSHVKDNQRDLDVQKATADDRSSGTHVDKTCTEESGSDSLDGQKVGRPMSPSTLALMCDEQDTIFMTSANPSTSPRFPHNQIVSEVYADQERGVLTAFRDSLLKLINCGRMKEAKYSSMMAIKSESPSLQEPVTNGIARTVSYSSAPIPLTVNPIQVTSNNNHHLPKAGHPVIENGSIKPKIENSET